MIDSLSSINTSSFAVISLWKLLLAIIKVPLIAYNLHAKCIFKSINSTCLGRSLSTSCCNFMVAAMQVRCKKWAAPKSQPPSGVIKDTRCRKPNVMEQNQTEPKPKRTEPDRTQLSWGRHGKNHRNSKLGSSFMWRKECVQLVRSMRVNSCLEMSLRWFLVQCQQKEC